MGLGNVSIGSTYPDEAVNDPQSFMIARQILQRNLSIEIDQIKNNNTDLKSLLKA